LEPGVGRSINSDAPACRPRGIQRIAASECQSMGYILRPSNIHAAAGSKKPRRRSARTALLAEHASQYRPYGHVRGPPANRQQQYPAVNVRMDVFALDEIGSRVLRTVVNDSGL